MTPSFQCLYVPIYPFVVYINQFFPSVSHSVHVQVEYYFSRENLCQDSFLVSKMDAQHFVDVAIIADFKMVKQLTSDTDLILACVAGSDKVCVHGRMAEENTDIG